MSHTPSRYFALLVVASLALATAGSGNAPALSAGRPPAGFRSTLVVGRLGQGVGGIPTAFAYAPDGRIFIGRKTGVVDVYKNGVHHVFLDISAEVNSSQGRGLLGLALDPHFATNRRVYVIFTRNANPPGPHAGGQIISVRAKAGDPNHADLSSRVTLLTGYDSSAPMHADVAIRFDRAGHLLAGFGDGTKDKVLKTALKAQDLDDLRGKIVRINPQTGEGVPGNPWYDASHPRSVRSKVYAFGLRNPFRFTVDPNNGTLYVGDVGWTAWDELDAFPANFSLPGRDRNGGWPCYEGAKGVSAPQERYQTSDLTRAACRKVYPPALHGTGHGAHAPLYAYRHGNTACIIAGPKYVGTSNYPAKYKGKVFVGDFTRDRFRTVDPATGVATDFGGPRAWGQPLDIQIAPDGNVAYLALATNSLREITYGS